MLANKVHIPCRSYLSVPGVQSETSDVSEPRPTPLDTPLYKSRQSARSKTLYVPAGQHDRERRCKEAPVPAMHLIVPIQALAGPV